MWHGVIDVVTPWHSPDSASADWGGDLSHLGPRQDTFMRVVDATQRVARALLLTGTSQVGPATYENFPTFVHWMHGTTRLDDGMYYVNSNVSWDFEGLISLEHSHFVETQPGDVQEALNTAELFRFWSGAIEFEFPMALAREHFLEARRLMRVTGEYGRAVTAYCTGIEVYLDATLSAMLWEQHRKDPSKPDAQGVAEFFKEGQAKQRAVNHTQKLLGGDWSSKRSAFTRWAEGASKLRNRILHAGYHLSKAEAQAAMDECDELQEFIGTRLTERRNAFPRCALIVVGVDGLKKRGKFKGQVKRFFEQAGPREDDWRQSFSQWHQEVMEAANRAN